MPRFSGQDDPIVDGLPTTPFMRRERDSQLELPSNVLPFPRAVAAAAKHVEVHESRWQKYENAGLTPAAAVGASKPAKQAAKLVVSGYRVLGISILTLIVAVLIGYIATTLFYFFSHTWIVPTVVSPSDDKVVAVRNELAAAQNQRDRTAADLHDTERAIAVEQTFQLEFARAVKDDLDGRRAALGRLRALAGAASSTRVKIRNTTDSYARSFAAQSSADFTAGLIDRDRMMSDTYQLSQMSSSTLSLAERQTELDNQAQELARETKALDALLADRPNTPLSYDVLKIKRDYEASKLALAKAIETRDTLKASLARQDETLAALGQSAFLRALADKATVALVPYGNLDHATPGAPLYACRIGMVVCHQAGAVIEVLPGEIQFKHPHTDSTERGQLVELRLTDPSAARDDVLFIGGKPLYF